MRTAEEILKLKGNRIVTVTNNSTIKDALRIMLEHKIGIILIKEDDAYIGIWSERDLMRNVIDPDFNPETALIKDYMNSSLVSAPSTTTIYELMDIFLGRYLRHLLIKKDGKYIGLLSIGDIIKEDLRHKSNELKELHAMVSWEYYEEWNKT